MSLLNFSDTPKQAFMRGFWKGMAAPVMIFANFEAPKQNNVVQVSVKIKNDTQSLMDDWNRIGLDFKSVISKHGEKTTTAK